MKIYDTLPGVIRNLFPHPQINPYNPLDRYFVDTYYQSKNGKRTEILLFYEDKNVPYTYEKLRGIYSNPGEVKKLESLLNFLKPRLKRGEYLIAYDELEILYYLTGTRPALRSIKLEGEDVWTLAQRKMFISKMIERNRVPRYVVRSLRRVYHLGLPDAQDNFYPDSPSVDPVNAFVIENYERIYTNGAYEVWQHK